MLIGDCNARVGDTQLWEFHPDFAGDTAYTPRKSKDKTIDSNGKKFIEMCESISLSLLNGRTKSDADGSLTFIRGNASSTIDYCLAKEEWLNCMLDLEIGEYPFSDHLPLLVTAKLATQNVNTEPERELLPKLIWNDKFVQRYQSGLDRVLDSICLSEPQTNHGIDTLTSCITIAAKPFQGDGRRRPTKKQPWYDADCLSARFKSFAALHLAKKTPTSATKLAYQKANSEYKSICKEKQRQYWLNLTQELSEARDSRDFWKLARRLNNREVVNRSRIHLEAGALAEYFEILLNPPTSSNHHSFAFPYTENVELDARITLLEIKNVTNACKLNKAPGVDRIPYEFYKFSTEKFLQYLTGCFNRIFDEGVVDENFRKSIIFPIFKKGSGEDASNYRGISFLNTVMKIFSAILLNRLTNWISENGLLSEFQAGFRKEYSTVDNIFTLTSIVKTYLDKGKKLYAFFVDFKAAFDSVDRNALFLKLSSVGVSTKILKVLQSMYEQNQAAVWDGNQLSHWFETKMGVKQGCLLSPLLFSLFLDDITGFLPGGIVFNGINIKCLMYADDIVLLAETPNMMQLMTNKLQQYCSKWNLKVNTSKSKIMVFRNGSGRYARDEKWIWEGEELEKVKEYKYLGVILTPKLSLEKHFRSKLHDAKMAINCNWKGILGKHNVATSVKYKLFEAVVRTIMCYAAQVWGLYQHDDVEKLLRYFLKKIFRLPENTPTYMLHLETGLPPLYLYTLQIHFNYIRKIMNYHQQRLPKIVASHIIERKSQFFGEWSRLCLEHNVQLDSNNPETWLNSLKNLWNTVRKTKFELFHDQARQSESRTLYRTLEHNLTNNYFHDNNSIDTISTIFKVRGELLYLNYMPHRTDRNTECTLCNRHTAEDVIHFIGTCPILNAIRRAHWGKNSLSMDELKTILNGDSWPTLFSYVKTAWKYRTQIITESF